MHSYPSSQILPHMGKDLSFLPSKYMAILDHMGKESSFLPLECKAMIHAFFLEMHPSPACPQKQHYPSPQILSHVGMDSSPFNPKPHKSFSANSFFIFLFLCHFYLSIFIYLFFFAYHFFFIISFEFSFLYFFHFFFRQNLEFFPKVEKLFPSI